MRLSARQRQVLKLMCEGLTNKRIAKRLGISPGTVKVHVSDVFRRTGARNRAEAIVRTLTNASA